MFSHLLLPYLVLAAARLQDSPLQRACPTGAIPIVTRTSRSKNWTMIRLVVSASSSGPESSTCACLAHCTVTALSVACTDPLDVRMLDDLSLEHFEIHGHDHHAQTAVKTGCLENRADCTSKTRKNNIDVFRLSDDGTLSRIISRDCSCDEPLMCSQKRSLGSVVRLTPLVVFESSTKISMTFQYWMRCHSQSRHRKQLITDCAWFIRPPTSPSI